MSAWDEDSIDEEEEGSFEFDDKGSGDFHFGDVQANGLSPDDTGWRASR
jgi:hypothetical protein